MPRFANMLIEGMQSRGHSVQIWSPNPYFYKLPFPATFRKWLGYIDQYLIFPAQVKRKLRLENKKQLFVFADQALGPWVPLVAHLPHVIHCHDFLAQASAMGQYKINPTSRTGKIYQKLIRDGYSKGRNFISVSRKTQDDLHKFLPAKPGVSEVVYNGLNQKYKLLEPIQAGTTFQNHIGIDIHDGFILHVGGNQWYKNRLGVIAIYNAWRSIKRMANIPLLLIGETPDSTLKDAQQASEFKNDIHFLVGITDDQVRNAYASASVFLFPSIAEGFGWPIAEAMASGTLVITTKDAPMTEVGGDAAFYIPNYNGDFDSWAKESAEQLETVLNLSQSLKEDQKNRAFNHIKMFDAELAINQIEKVYLDVFSK